MGGINQVLKLKEQAEEDIYFARLDRELIEKLHQEASTDAAGEARAAADSRGISGQAAGTASRQRPAD
jgi:hypothetical protein